MTTTHQHLNDVHNQIRTDDKVMKEARHRRDRVLALAASFPGVRATYSCGSVAMGVVIDPVSDADGGIVLDRRTYPKLGPDGDNELPDELIDQLRDHIGPQIREDWPKAKVRVMRRGLSVYFNDPVLGQDPYVDLVVALERKEGQGLWIPNVPAGRWDASDPEGHAALMNAGVQSVKTARARTVRLAKAWNKQYSEPALCSFNIVALALGSVTEAGTLDETLYTFFDDAVRSLRSECTPDPAGVSAAIKLPLGKDIAIRRLTEARDALAAARATDNDDDRLDALHKIFGTYLPASDDARSKHSLAQLLTTSAPKVSTVGAGVTVVGATKPTRAYGGPR